MWAIAGREWRSLFLSPLAWSLLGVVQLILGWAFAVRVGLYLEPNVQAELGRMSSPPGVTEIVVRFLFDWTGIVLLLVIPLLTMRLISEERRQKSLPLLLSAPQPMYAIVLGKYLGLMGFFAVMLGMIMLMPLSLLIGTSTLDWGQIGSGLVGISLMVAAMSAIGLYISVLSGHPTIAAISTFGVLLLLWVLNISNSGDYEFLQYLSLTEHYQALLRGLFDSADVLYYLLVIALFLLLSIQRLDAERFE